MRDDGLDDWSEKLPDGANGMNGAAVLPRLVINGKDLTATAKQLAGLFAADGRFLTNGNTPVMVTPDKGMPRAIEVTPDSVRIVAHEISRPVTISKKSKLVEVTLSKDVANLYLVGLEGRWGLNPLHGITTAPILEDDGSIRIAEGYDVKSGLWCHAVPDLKMQEQPTTNDPKRALIRLRRYFSTFAFADGIRAKNTNPAEIDISTNPGMDESVFLVALMMAVCRQSLELAPGFLCDAPSISGSGTGKGLLVKSMVMIASGIRPAAFTSGHDKEEFDKRLTAALIEARPAIFLDNYNAKDLKSDILASVLTESPAMVRVMGRTKTVPLHARTFIGITGKASPSRRIWRGGC